MEDLTPMMKQYHDVKRRFPGKLVFFRLGDFYEMFYDDAVVAARDLEITLTARNKDKSGAPIPMCGVPHHSVSSYVARLLRKGHKIVVCEQTEAPAPGKQLFRREVTRVLTPGTVVEDVLLDPKEHNYLASFTAGAETAGLAVVDLSTGDFLATELSGPESWSRAVDQLVRFRPREILLPDDAAEELRSRLARDWPGDWVASPVEAWAFNRDYAERLLLEQFKTATLAGFGSEGRPLAVGAAGALLHYLRETQLRQVNHISGMRFFEAADSLVLDAATLQNLEVVQTLGGSRKGSLLDLLDRTRTGMGGRMLKSWLLAPLRDTEALERRLDAVADVGGELVGRDRVARSLERVHDLERLTSRITLGTATPRELVAMAVSLEALPQLRSELGVFASERLRGIACELEELPDVRDRIRAAISDDPPASPADPGIIRSGYSKELDELRTVRHSGKEFIARLEAEERRRTGIASLKVKYNGVFGYFIEVTRPNLPQVPPDYRRRQTLANCERFSTSELQAYEEKVLGAEERIAELERELFVAVRKSVADEAARILRAARLVAEIDVYVSLAEVAVFNDYTRPALVSGDDLYIRQGRHPLVERTSRPFIPNDIYINASTDQLLILTGPNMGGKSTYLRQTALIVILAQVGSFVPAREARVGLVDRIYTRVGASDDLARGRSTFMVEMIETANILNTATPLSLILLDEVGRGTATFDGLSIAWAVAEYLVRTPRRAKTIFATHYHELTRMSEVEPGVKNYCMAIEEVGNEIVFLRKIEPGVADKSYGIEVARLAGLPREVLERASDILARLERKEIDLTAKPRTRTGADSAPNLQKSLFR
jgi:DNA mismatch repair protein MutS